MGEDDGESKTVGVRVSCAMKPPERYLQEDEVYRFARLKLLRNLVGPGTMSYKSNNAGKTQLVRPTKKMKKSV